MNTLRAGELLANRFAIETIAGTGGMGTVYRAIDRYTGKLVALKLLHSSDAVSSERFSREAQLLSELCHPGIVAYIAHGSTLDGQYYLAMEWLQGEDLAVRLLRRTLSLQEAIALIQSVAAALATAHAKGVVHRDLKPSNLFLVDRQIHKVKILDFGIARQLGSMVPLTQTGLTVGTPQYMAPEQARGVKNLTSATDIFALGCVLYECLAGQRPFVGEHGMAVLVRVLLEDPEPISKRLPGIAPELAALLQRMLAKDASQRPADAAALLAELESLGTLPTLKVEGGASEAPALSGLADSEQQLLCVVIASPPTAPDLVVEERTQTLGKAEATTVAKEMQHANREALEQELRLLGAQLEWLIDGTLVAVVAGQSSLISSAADQVRMAARCALTIKRQWSRSEVAIGTGPGLVRQQLPAGEVVDRTVKLLHAQTRMELERTKLGRTAISGVWLDRITEGLLGAEFIVSRVGEDALLQEKLSGERQHVDQSRRLMGKPTPCVGREAELTILEGQLANCIDESEARALIITAPPGTGKSRLLHEFLRRLGQRSTEVMVVQGRADMVSAGAPYGILAQAVRRLCGLSGSELLQEHQQAIADRIGSVVTADQRTRVTEFIGELCGLRFADDGSGRLLAAREDPRLMRDQITRAFIDWLHAESKRASVLLVLDDLHWGDGLSVGLVEESLRELRSQPFMVLTLGRPELKKGFPRLWQVHNVQEIALKGLSKRASERLVQQVLGKAVSAESIERIIQQSGGNVLFLEELIRTVGEGKIDEKPETVLAMLQARIGRLLSGPRRLVLAASVYGQTFWQGGAAALLGLTVDVTELQTWLSNLVELEMIEPRAVSRLAGEREFTFRHALLRDAAYSLLVVSALETGHRLASQYLAKSGETDGMVIGDHAEKGGDILRALGFFTQAAEQAFARYDLPGALSRADRALRCNPQEEALGNLYALQSAALIWSNEFMKGFELGQRGLALLPKGTTWWCRDVQNLAIIASGLPDAAPIYQLADSFGDEMIANVAPFPYAQATATMVMELGIMGDRGRARHFLRLAEEVCGRLTQDHAIAQAYLDSCRSWQVVCSEPDPWLAYCCGQRSGQQNRLTEDWRSLMIGDLGLALAEDELGGNRQGIERIRPLMVLGERLNEPFVVLVSKTYLLLLLGSRPSDNFAPSVQELIEELRRSPLQTAQGMAQRASAQFALYKGDAVRAESEARLAINSFPIMVPYRLSAMATLINALLRQGRPKDAQATAEEALELLAKFGGAGFPEVPLRLTASEAFHAAGDNDRARTELAETLRQVQVRADNIADPVWKNSYLTNNPSCSRAQQLEREWLLGGPTN